METKFEATQPQFTAGGMGSEFNEFHRLISGPPVTTGSSFTALLELPPPQVVELLVKEDFPTKHAPPPIFPTDIGLIHRASKFSIFASADNSLENMKLDAVKQEHLGSDSRRNSSSPADSDQCLKYGKRKERDKKAKESNKKSKNMTANEPSDDDGEKLSYVHVRARRGQATDSHSLAERARREKINARMKLLQELVPGCNKISGTATVLDEIINHVQALQRQVEFLSMRLATVTPGIDSDVDSLFASNGSSNESGMFTPPIFLEGQMIGPRQLQFEQLWHCDELHQSVWASEADSSNFITPENTLLNDTPQALARPVEG